ncbi:MAG: hypothetical protein AAFY76_03205 [Cyanobacteria bacterium J06649_11]
MKKMYYAFTFCLLFNTCSDDDMEIILPPEPNYTPASEIEINITSSTDEYGYTVLEDCYVGSWNKSTIPSTDGNVIIVGNARSGYSDPKIVLIKTDVTGNILYYRTVFDDQYGQALGVCEDSNQDMYLVGFTLGADGLQNRTLAVAKLNVEGDILWERNYHPMEEDITGVNISILSNDEIIVSGSQSGNLVFLKINSFGEEISFEIQRASSYASPNGMIVLDERQILITETDSKEFILRWYDENFQLLQEKKYGARNSYAKSTIQLMDGNLLSIGHITYTSEGSNSIDSQAVQLIKIDLEGELIWEKAVGDLNYLNDGQSIKENFDGSLVLNGYTEDDHMLIYVDSQGNEINSKYYTDDKTFRGKNIIKIENGRNILTGGYQRGTFFLNVDNYGL